MFCRAHAQKPLQNKHSSPTVSGQDGEELRGWNERAADGKGFGEKELYLHLHTDMPDCLLHCWPQNMPKELIAVPPHKHVLHLPYVVIAHLLLELIKYL